MGGGITGAEVLRQLLSTRLSDGSRACGERRGKHFKREQDAQQGMAWRVASAEGLKDGEPQPEATRETAHHCNRVIMPLNAAPLRLSCALSQRSA